jgi:hypothetical protein
MDVPTEDWKACRACRADIVFAETNRMHKGKPVIMPVDVDPNKRDAKNQLGNVILTFYKGKYHAGVPKANQAAGMRDAGQKLHHSHFNTCTQPERFRHNYGTGGK